jgi:FAD/FMN-containing dehydrogenase
MIGNNSCGAHAQMSGRCDQNVEELDLLLYDGTRMNVGWMNDAELDRRIAQGGRAGEIFRYLRSLRSHYAGLIRDKYPRIPRRVSGYNLDQLLPGDDGRFNIARSLVGSEGTLATILEAKVRLIDAKAERVILLLGYPDVYEAADHVMDIVPFQPTALEGIDHDLYQNIEKKAGPNSRYLKLLPEGGVQADANEADDPLDFLRRAVAGHATVDFGSSGLLAESLMTKATYSESYDPKLSRF